MDADEAVTIPADIDREDRVLANLSARQLAILIPAGALVWLAYISIGALVPLPVFAAVAIPFTDVSAAAQSMLCHMREWPSRPFTTGSTDALALPAMFAFGV